MAVTLLRRGRRRQPQGRIQIRWRISLAQGLCFLAEFGPSPGIDRVSGSGFEQAGEGVLVPTTRGQGRKFAQTQRWSSSALITSEGAGSGDYTLLSVSAPVAEGVVSAIFSFCGASNGGQCYILANTNAGYGAASGNIAFGNFPGALGTVAGVVDGNPHVFVLVRRGGVATLYVDGIERGSVSASGDVIDGLGRFSVEGIAGYGGWYSANTTHIREGAWNRALEPAEIVKVSANPAALFAARRRALARSAGGALSLTGLTMSNFTSSGARATLSITR